MSDPVTNAEIEDVLSSIRRLVSEDGRPKPREAAETKLSLEQKLVLTPALRVTEPDPVPDSPDAEFANDDGPEPELRPAPAPDADQIKLPDVPDAAPPERATPEASEKDTDGQYRELKDPSEATASLEMADDEPEKAPVSDPESRQDDDPMPPVPLRQAMAVSPERIEENAGGDDATEAQADSGEESEPGPLSAWAHSAPDMPDTIEPDATGLRFDNPAKSEGQHDADAANAQETEPGSDFVWPVRRSDMRADVAPTKAETGTPEVGPSLGAKAAILEAAIGKTKDQWDPDDLGSDDYAGTPVKGMTWDDETAPEKTIETNADPSYEDHRQTSDNEDAVPEKRAPIAGSAVDEPLDLAAVGETVLDEDSLRELVSEIVRQELQGPLGERITRNVRKLVRREIHRALSIQELE